MSTQIVYIDNDIRPESEWDIDGEACALCEKHFSLIGRRHHCRSCGLCACDSCAPYTIALTKNKIETCRIRICTVCSQSSLAVSPLSRISHPATPIVKGKSAGSSSNEPTEINLKSSPEPSSSSTSDPSGESPLLRPANVIVLKSSSPLDDTTQGLKTPPRTAGPPTTTVPADPPSGKRGSIASNATVFEGSEDGRAGYKNIDAERAGPLPAPPPGVRSPSSLLSFRLPTWGSSASSTASSRRSESPSKRSSSWRARSAHADIINASAHSSSGLHHHDHLSSACSSSSSFSDDDSSIVSGDTAPDIDDQGLPQHHRSCNDPTGRFSFSSLQGALYDYPTDVDELNRHHHHHHHNVNNITTTNDLSGTILLPKQQKNGGGIPSSSPHSSPGGHIPVSVSQSVQGPARQPTPLHHIHVSSSSRASVGGASRVSNSSSSTIIVVKCANCKKSIRTGTALITIASKNFCSKNCAFTSDYLDKATLLSSSSANPADINAADLGNNPLQGKARAGSGSGFVIRTEKERQQEEKEIARALTQKMKGRDK